MYNAGSSSGRTPTFGVAQPWFESKPGSKMKRLFEKIGECGKDSTCQFWVIFSATALFGIVAIIAWLFPVNVDRKEVSFLFSEVQFPLLVHVDGLEENDIRVLYQEEEIKNIANVKIRIENTGTVPILPEDYVEPVRVQFPEKNRVLRFEIVSDVAFGSSTENGIEISKSILNPGDNILLETLFEVSEENFLVDDVILQGRIVGVSNFKRVQVDEWTLAVGKEKKEKARDMIKGSFILFTKEEINVLIGLVIFTVFIFIMSKTPKRIWNIFRTLFFSIVILNFFSLVVMAVYKIFTYTIPLIFSALGV
jgi:uncharacterized integral membrane protein